MNDTQRAATSASSTAPRRSPSSVTAASTLVVLSSDGSSAAIFTVLWSTRAASKPTARRAGRRFGDNQINRDVHFDTADHGAGIPDAGLVTEVEPRVDHRLIETRIIAKLLRGNSEVAVGRVWRDREIAMTGT